MRMKVIKTFLIAFTQFTSAAFLFVFDQVSQLRAWLGRLSSSLLKIMMESEQKFSMSIRRESQWPCRCYPSSFTFSFSLSFSDDLIKLLSFFSVWEDQILSETAHTTSQKKNSNVIHHFCVIIVSSFADSELTPFP